MKTYCINSNCPFKECNNHLSHVQDIEDKSELIKVANFDSICREYMNYLVTYLKDGWIKV